MKITGSQRKKEKNKTKREDKGSGERGFEQKQNIRIDTYPSVELFRQASNISTPYGNHGEQHKYRKVGTSCDWPISWFMVKQGRLFTLEGFRVRGVLCEGRN